MNTEPADDEHTPLTMADMMAHNISMNDCMTLVKWAQRSARPQHNDESDDDYNKYVQRVMARTRNRTTRGQSVGQRPHDPFNDEPDTVVPDHDPAYGYNLFSTWIVPVNAHPLDTITCDVAVRGGGAVRGDGRRKLYVYVNPNNPELFQLIAAVDTITGGAEHCVRYGNSTQGTVWLSNSNDAVVETVQPAASDYDAA